MRSAEESRMNISRGSGQGIYLSSEWRPPIGKTYLFEVYQRCLLCGISPLQRKRKGEDPRQPQPSLLRGRVLGGYPDTLKLQETRSRPFMSNIFSALGGFSQNRIIIAKNNSLKSVVVQTDRSLRVIHKQPLSDMCFAHPPGGCVWITSRKGVCNRGTFLPLYTRIQLT